MAAVVVVVDLKLTTVEYLGIKKTVRGVHILNRIFMGAFFFKVFEISNAETATFRFWGSGEEVLEGSSYQNTFSAAVYFGSRSCRILTL